MAWCHPYALLYLVIQSWVSLSLSASTPCKFPAIFNFGDSNSDTGGIDALLRTVKLPNGETFFHYAAGRNCDGRLIIDFIATSLNQPLLNAYLDAMGATFAHGVNFALSVSTVLRNPVTRLPGGFTPFPLAVQLEQYKRFLSRFELVAKRGRDDFIRMPRKEYFVQGLYTFDIGQNDLTAVYFANKTTKDALSTIPHVVGNISDVIKEIYSYGGRNFWVHNTGPLGCLAYVLVLFSEFAGKKDKAGCSSVFNDVAIEFNKKLLEGVVSLRKELPQAAITYVDIYTPKYALFANTTKNGFQHSIEACCGLRDGTYNFNTSVLCGAVGSTTCNDPSMWVIWDGVHYTEKANQWVFKQVVNGQYTDSKLPLTMACHNTPT